MHIYHLKNCDTCKKAIKAMAGHEPELVDIRKDGMPVDVLKILLDQFPPEVVMNRKSTTWRNLSEAERDRPPLDLMIENPTLMKRPVIYAGKQYYIGWGKDVQAALDAI